MYLNWGNENAQVLRNSAVRSLSLLTSRWSRCIWASRLPCTACAILREIKISCGPVPVAVQSTAQVHGRSPGEIVGSNPTGGMDVCCECCVLSGRSLCDELISHPEGSYWLWCIVVCDLETSWMRRPWPTGGCHTKNKQTNEVSCEEYILTKNFTDFRALMNIKDFLYCYLNISESVWM